MPLAVHVGLSSSVVLPTLIWSVRDVSPLATGPGLCLFPLHPKSPIYGCIAYDDTQPGIVPAMLNLSNGVSANVTVPS